ncbi:hypothetical protein [Mycolicibacterium sp. CBMA 226]|uniref:hypothetical protein n=1 Tax=Mycolicibacterium sp. CBMA 226 TaxID=2606611 RepID=UPI001317D365|nr:hypothetical protein [Mycolicibacterium sp. CBMA 226]QGW61135.1 hypothetical protein ICEMyc226_00103 [Mycolicibacterium sp.]
MSAQYDLFGEIEAAELAASTQAAARRASAMQFLAETPWPDLLAWWLHPDVIETQLDYGECKASYRRGRHGTPGWAWAIWRDGLRFEAGDTWQGWQHRPRWCIPWAELRTLRSSRPDTTAQLADLAAGRGHPRAAGRRWWTDPHSLTQGWHPDALQAEQNADWYDGCERPDAAWPDRLMAWQLVIAAVRETTVAAAITDTGAKRRHRHR